MYAIRSYYVLKDNKSINVPSIHLQMDYISEKDRNDILFGIENDVDFIARITSYNVCYTKLLRCASRYISEN